MWGYVTVVFVDILSLLISHYNIFVTWLTDWYAVYYEVLGLVEETSVVFTCTFPSWCKMSPSPEHLWKNHLPSPFRGGKNGSIPVPLSHFHITRQPVVHPHSRTVSHPMDKKLSSPLPAHPFSKKAIGTIFITYHFTIQII